MKTIFTLAGCIALAACTQTEAPDEDDATEVAAPEVAGTQPGLYQVTQADGATTQSRLKADGNYEDYGAEGEIVESGTWTAADGKSCFDPEGDPVEYCFTDGPVSDDGSMTVTAPDGTVMTVKPIVEEATD